MVKLKIKAKSEDSGSKARQYLDGLLKIPLACLRKNQYYQLWMISNKIFMRLLKC